MARTGVPNSGCIPTFSTVAGLLVPLEQETGGFFLGTMCAKNTHPPLKKTHFIIGRYLVCASEIWFLYRSNALEIAQ